MDIPKKTALENLQEGRIEFILKADPSRMGELKKIDPSAPFYAGLLVKDAGDPQRAEALFELAAESPSPRVRSAAAWELLPFLTGQEGDASLAARILKLKRGDLEDDPALKTLKNAALWVLGAYTEIPGETGSGEFSSWNRAFALLASLKTASPAENRKQEVMDYFLTGPMDAPRIWAAEEIKASFPGLLGGGLDAALEGRIAVSKSGFNEGIGFFKTVLEENQALFFHYADLLNDLGRSYQFTKYQDEGLKLFLDWESWLAAGSGLGASLLTIDIPNTRYRLLYFAGRIERQRQNYPGAAELFTKALELAPDPAQEDACIWYILNVYLLDNPGKALPLLPGYIKRWNDDTYFTDIMDRVSRHLVSSRQWDTLLELFSLIRGKSDGATIAKYAYIIARSIMEGYLSPESAGPYLENGKNGSPEASGRIYGRPETATAFFRIAFEESRGSFYYRALSASFLGERVDPVPGKAGLSLRKPSAEQLKHYPHGESLAFLLNFFEFGAGRFAYTYFKNLPLTLEEQRIAAQGFILAEYWDDAIRVCSAFMGRDDYELQRQDMELFYPRPYAALIESNARELGIPVEVFFGLIRTESAFNAGITSWAGAFGLSQLMPPTALDMAGRISRRGGPDYVKDGKIDLHNPEINIHIGAWYLNYLIEYTGSPMLALMAYNGGMGRVRRWRALEPQLPEDLFLETIEYPETRDYGRKVLAAAAAYGYLYYGMSMEAVIADIFTMDHGE